MCNKFTKIMFFCKFQKCFYIFGVNFFCVAASRISREKRKRIRTYFKCLLSHTEVSF